MLLVLTFARVWLLDEVGGGLVVVDVDFVSVEVGGGEGDGAGDTAGADLEYAVSPGGSVETRD